MKNKLVCEYEFPQGRTRTQALSEGHKHLQRQLRTCTSLIKALQCANSKTSWQILENLRRGDYSGTLSLDDTAFGTTSPATISYPWEHASNGTGQNGKHCGETLPAISTLVPLHHNPTVLPCSPSVDGASAHHFGEIWQRKQSVQLIPGVQRCKETSSLENPQRPTSTAPPLG